MWQYAPRTIRSPIGRSTIGIMFALAIIDCLLGVPAQAFDTGPHFDLTRDALSAEGFGDTGVQVAQVTNWMVDFYEQASQNPFSGRSAWWKELIGGAIGYREHWSDTVVDSADWLHFDPTPHFDINNVKRGLDSGETMTMEWERLAKATRIAASDCAGTGDIQGLLTVIGITTHAVQDFYAHTNWVEPKVVLQTIGYEGPGWAQLHTYGSHPTWFDVPPDVRQRARVYSCIGGDLRSHGYWNTDGNRTLRTAVNKDWPGRPLYKDAYITAYFATRQWVNAIRSCVNNEAVWQAAQRYSDRKGGQLDRDLNGAYSISFDAGHWQGQGEPTGADAPGPGGSLDDLIVEIGKYHRAGKTAFRSKFEQVVPKIALENPTGVDVPVDSSSVAQNWTEFVCLKVTRVRDATPTGMIGIDPGLDQADFYAKPSIAGQTFSSGMIHGRDTFDFNLPNYPFTFIKAVPKMWSVPEPVTSMYVLVRTRDEMWAGTDDDVFLIINSNTRFKLDKPLYNDFERGDEDTYSIDPPAGLKVSDIRYVQIDKSPDGLAGGWELSRVRLSINGRSVYYKDGIDKWLEKSSLTWRAPDFHPSSPMTSAVPITLKLYDSDGFLYGDDDHCDINPDYGRRNLNLLYNRSSNQVRGDASGTGIISVTGGSRHGGRGIDDDTCQISFMVEKYQVTPPPSSTVSTQPNVSVTVSADPTRYTGSLPASISFIGRITASQPCDVRYQFVRSDGTMRPIATLHFDTAGTRDAGMTWSLSRNYSGWVSLKVLSPRSVESSRAQFEVASGGSGNQPFEEDLISFDYRLAEVKQIGGRWKIAAGSIIVKDFGANEAAARRALQIMKHYKMNSQGFVGRPNPSMEYFLVDGAAPSGVFPGEDRLSFNPVSLEVKQASGRWKVADGSHQVLDFGGGEQEARIALQIIRKYGFTSICFVARPNPPMTYFRR